MSFPTTISVEPTRLERGAELVLLGREVDPRKEHLCDGRRRAVAPARERLVQQPLEKGDRLGEPEVVRRRERPARVGEQRPVLADQRKVGLRVAAVDGDDDRLAHPATPASESGSSASSASSSDPASSSWPISGCARSALRAVTGHACAPPRPSSRS